MSYVCVTFDPDTKTLYTLNELFACRVCLATDAKLFNLHEFKLTQMFEDLTGTPVSVTDGLPQHICTICYRLLCKSAAFRAQCRQTHIFLQDARIKQPMITTEYISNLRNLLPNSTFKLFKTNTLHVGVPPTGANKNNPEEPVVIDVESDVEEIISPDIAESSTHDVSINNNTDERVHVFYPSMETGKITEYNNVSNSKAVRFKIKRKNFDRPSPLKTNDKTHGAMSFSSDSCTQEYILHGNFKSRTENKEIGRDVSAQIDSDLMEDPLTCQEFTINNPTDLQEFTELTPENANNDYNEIILITEANDDNEILEDTTISHEEYIIKEESY